MGFNLTKTGVGAGLSLSGGVGRVLAERYWTPELLGSDLVLWLDAADASTITLNGSTVSQWNDKSGNGRNATQATSANQPVYTTNAINGLSVLTFANTPKSFVMPSGVYATNPKVFVVIRSTSNSALQVPLRLQGSRSVAVA